MNRYIVWGSDRGLGDCCRADDNGEWVKADVAQGLYDALMKCHAMGMLTVGYDSGADHKRLCAEALDAIKAADGGES